MNFNNLKNKSGIKILRHGFGASISTVSNRSHSKPNVHSFHTSSGSSVMRGARTKTDISVVLSYILSIFAILVCIITILSPCASRPYPICVSTIRWCSIIMHLSPNLGIVCNMTYKVCTRPANGLANRFEMYSQRWLW